MSGMCAARVDYPRRGVQALPGDEEFFLPFDCFPWFESATVEQTSDVEWPTAGHLYWTQLDIDLAVDSIRDPAAFPLVSSVQGWLSSAMSRALSGRLPGNLS